jgi:uncharacterized RDD family membrane protein YckC
VLFFKCSLLTGVDASAAQKRPVTKTCLQCGAVQPANLRVCSFCDSLLDAPRAQSSLEFSDHRRTQDPRVSASPAQPPSRSEAGQAWRGELEQRVQAYRARRRKGVLNAAQSKLPFEDAAPEPPIIPISSVAIEDEPIARPVANETEDFAFTIAIGRNAATRDESRMVIDVSQPPATNAAFAAVAAVSAAPAERGMYPVASIDERRLAGLIDAACLLFAYGGFLALFGSLGGQFTPSKLSAAICVSTFVIVYLQYFALFTVFGGTTPGMMLRGLHVVNFGGDAPPPRQMLWRSVGYMLSAGTLFLGFLWAIWDEDGLTWHDRLSQTYLATTPTFADIDATHAHVHAKH